MCASIQRAETHLVSTNFFVKAETQENGALNAVRLAQGTNFVSQQNIPLRLETFDDKLLNCIHDTHQLDMEFSD